MKTKTNKQQAGSVNNTKLLQQRITHGKQQHTSWRKQWKHNGKQAADGENPEKRGEDAGGRLWGNYGQVRTISFRKQFVPIPEHSMQTTPRDWVPSTRDQKPKTKDLDDAAQVEWMNRCVNIKRILLPAKPNPLQQ